jgi:hypothetical protein
MQALIRTDGEYVHMSPVYCGYAHGKTKPDDSQVMRFLTTGMATVHMAKWF